ALRGAAKIRRRGGGTGFGAGQWSVEILRRTFLGPIGRRRRNSLADSDGARPGRGGQRNSERRVGDAGAGGAAVPRGSVCIDRAGATEQDPAQSLAVCGLVLERRTVSIPRVRL